MGDSSEEYASGFVNIRDNTTKTMSILDRLEKLTLPKLSDVKSGLEKYLEQRVRVGFCWNRLFKRG